MARPSSFDDFDTRQVQPALAAAPRGRLGFHELADPSAVPRRHRPRFRRFLTGLVREGRLRLAKGRGYRAGNAHGAAEEVGRRGIVSRHREGFGFLRLGEGEDDLFLSPREMTGLFAGDEVRALSVPGRFGRAAGRVTGIAARRRAPVPGTFRRVGAGHAVFPDPEVYDEPIELVPGAVEPRDGEVVEVEIVEWPERRRAAVGRVVEILGARGELGTILELVIRRHEIRRRFPDDVLEEAGALPETPGAADLAGRTDLRDEPTFTIDGADARDFDDAVSVQPGPGGGFLLKVSIADVAHWVTDGSALDREALERGTSVYLPDRVIPMLPERLSNTLASLQPAQDRLTLTVEMELDAGGDRRRTRMYESVIRSHGRWTYENVARVLRGETVEGISEHAGHLQRMLALMKLRQAARRARGSLDFDLPEPDVILDATGHPEDVVRAERNDAHRIIEELMILANEAVADWFVERQRATVFRVHAPPDPAKLRGFLEFARSWGHLPEFGTLATSRALAEFLESVRGLPAERAIHHILLRTMMRASYSETNTGHYGLASERYLHFTSPIRRYPDLIVHRLVKAALRGQGEPVDRARLARVAAQSSAREETATRCEFDVLDVMRAWYLKDRLGEEYEGIVSGVIEDGFFVELLDVYVEGMVRTQDLTDDSYRFLREPRVLVGRRLKRRFAIGDPVRVAVQAVHPASGRVEFALLRGGGRARRG